MASDEVYEFDVAIPAGTLKATPLVTLTQLPSRRIDEIRWFFPPGSVGAVGIQIGCRSVPVIPRNAGGFIVRSGQSDSYGLSKFPDSGDWSVIGYNTGTFAHTVFVTFLVSVIRRVEPQYLILEGGSHFLSMGES